MPENCQSSETYIRAVGSIERGIQAAEESDAYAVTLLNVKYRARSREESESRRRAEAVEDLRLKVLWPLERLFRSVEKLYI